MRLIPQEDIDFLEEKGYTYTLVQSGPEVHLVIRDFPFPNYQPSQSDLLIRFLAGYPQTALDMFYTSPNVQLASGAFPLKADQLPVIDGKTWQQWSRHLAWRSGVDNLRTFLAAVVAEINQGI